MTNPIKMTGKINSAGNINVFIEDEVFQVNHRHPNYDQFVQAFQDSDAETFKRLYHEFEMRFYDTETHDIKEKINFSAESIEYRGQKITDPVMIKNIKNYNTQCDAIKHFIDNMFLNPRPESVVQLASFLEHNNFPLTEDGCFLGYKAVKKNYMDIYSGTIDNSIGRTITMPRAKVTFDPKLACSAGLHVGTYSYATGYGGSDAIILVVKVNPAHCVSVPNDHNAEKLRCSQYTVLGECTDTLPMNMVYTADGQQLKVESYFADIRDNEEYRRTRPSCQPEDYDDDDYDDEDDDWESDDWDDDEDEDECAQYVCDNCCWSESREAVEDGIGPIAWCPKCGSALEIE
jgi:hypothetical protein